MHGNKRPDGPTISNPGGMRRRGACTTRPRPLHMYASDQKRQRHPSSSLSPSTVVVAALLPLPVQGPPHAHAVVGPPLSAGHEQRHVIFQSEFTLVSYVITAAVGLARVTLKDFWFWGL